VIANRSRQQRWAALSVVVGLALTGLGLLAYTVDLMRPLELAAVDARFSLRGQQPPPSGVVLVEIDPASTAELKLPERIPRRWHGRVIRRISEGAPKAIAVDLQFTEGTGPGGGAGTDDELLALAIADAGNVALVTDAVNEYGESNVLGGEEVLRQLGARAGHSGFPGDSGNVVRRMVHAVDKLETLAIVAVEVATGRQVPASALGGESAWIDFHGPPGTIRTVSYADVLKGRAPRGLFRGKVAVVGDSAERDAFFTSTTKAEPMSGAEIHANAIATALDSFPLKDSPAGLDVPMIVLLGMLLPVAGLRLRPIFGVALVLCVAGAFVVAAQLAFNNGLLIPLAYPLAALVVAALGAAGVRYAGKALGRVHDRFSQFVPGQVVEEVTGKTGDVRLSGVTLDGTVMFADLRDFTRFSERLDPESLVEVLNRYLSEMSDAVIDHGGTVIDYMGDGIMAVFGAPTPQADHADRALAAAQEMLRERLPRFNEWLRSRRLGEGFRMGIGLNSGAVLSGAIGSERRLGYSAIGDTTNTASRIEALTRETPHQLFVAESTYQKLTRTSSELVFVGEVQVRGRETRVKVWSLADAVIAQGRRAK
jgi:adenylate cyclase